MKDTVVKAVLDGSGLIGLRALTDDDADREGLAELLRARGGEQELLLHVEPDGRFVLCSIDDDSPEALAEYRLEGEKWMKALARAGVFDFCDNEIDNAIWDNYQIS